MHTLDLWHGNLRRVLCLGAHCDDIELGCGGTLMRLVKEIPGLAVDWVVFTGTAEREAETRAAAADLLAGAGEVTIVVERHSDGLLPAELASLKDSFRRIASGPAPDLVLTQHRGDFHQDHRTLAELTWQTFRDHLIWEYEIPKYDGDLGRPNLYLPLPEELVERKVDILMRHFRSQHARPWFSPDTFRALPRLRGIEAGGGTGWAEAFYASKLVIGR